MTLNLALSSDTSSDSVFTETFECWERSGAGLWDVGIDGGMEVQLATVVKIGSDETDLLID